MRWSWVFAISCGVAAATSTAAARPGERPRDGSFWREVIEPHADEVAALLTKAREAMARPESPINGDTDWAVEARARFFRDAFNLLRHARTLSPDNLEVLALYGRAADELGLTTEAIDALARCARLGGDKAPAEVRARLGTIYVRLGQPEVARRWLAAALGPLSAQTAPAFVHLATLLAERGELTAAVDTLANAVPAGLLAHYSSEAALVTFALAVLYDRDEQRGAAFTTLDTLQRALGPQYALQLLDALAKLRFAHAADLHYYRGLLYESLGHAVEARAEWAHYAAAGDSPWRQRALDHIAELDAPRARLPRPRP